MPQAPALSDGQAFAFGEKRQEKEERVDMLIGMTGFGRSHFKDKTIDLNLQIRSINSRYFETVFHLPPNLTYLEDEIKKCLHEKIKRGRVTVNLSASGAVPSSVRLNKPLAKQYVRLLNGVRRELAVSGELTLAQLSGLPGVMILEESILPEELIRPKAEKLLFIALNNLLTMRAKEGVALSADVSGRLNKITAKLKFIRQRLALFIAQKRKGLKGVSASGEEISAFIKGCDIAEEITRLAFHVKAFGDKVRAKKSRDNAVGKELDFIAQEMQREANTMGAKSQDARLSSAVIEIKSQIEKIREQIQNAE